MVNCWIQRALRREATDKDPRQISAMNAFCATRSRAISWLGLKHADRYEDAVNSVLGVNVFNDNISKSEYILSPLRTASQSS